MARKSALSDLEHHLQQVRDHAHLAKCSNAGDAVPHWIEVGFRLQMSHIACNRVVKEARRAAEKA